jgi:hypothetical protein
MKAFVFGFTAAQLNAADAIVEKPLPVLSQ